MAEEVEAHIAMRVDELVRGGMSRERARAVALERFGDRAVLMRTVVERERRLSRGERMQNLMHDLKLAWRHASREPGTSALTVATFALGIGLTTAMFTVVDRVLLRPLAYAQPEQLVALWGENEGRICSPRYAQMPRPSGQRRSSDSVARRLADGNPQQARLDRDRKSVV